jgi:hypothetical protein
MPTPRDTAPREFISGLDDLTYRVQLTDARTGAAVTAGVVSMRLVRRHTSTPLHATHAVCSLTHTANGEWVGEHDAPAVALAIAAVPLGGEFDRIVVADGYTAGRLLAVCTRVAVA